MEVFSWSLWAATLPELAGKNGPGPMSVFYILCAAFGRPFHRRRVTLADKSLTKQRRNL
jgi:hypothetical protein